MGGWTRQIFRRHYAMVWAVLGIGVLLLGLVNHALFLQSRQASEQQFRLRSQDLHEAIVERLRQQEQILLGGAGLFDISSRVSRNAWRIYVERLKLTQNYPGIQGVGYSELIAPNRLQAHERAVQAEGFPGYRVRPPGKRDVYTAIVFLEPFRDRNLAAFGYDMFSEPVRNRAMSRAALNGETAISGKVTLVQETHGRQQAGFLMYVPVYRHDLPLATAQQRWHALQGFVYSPFRMDDLMRGLLGEGGGRLDFSIYDGDEESPQALMYDSRLAASPPQGTAKPGTHTQTRPLQAYGHRWTVRYHSRADLASGWLSSSSAVWLLPGMGVVLLLMLLAYQKIQQREQLDSRTASQMSQSEEQLRVSEARLSLAQRTAHIGSWELNLVTGTLHWTDEVFRIFEIDPTRFSATYEAFLRAIHPDDREAVNKAYSDSLISRQPYEIRHRLLMPDGRVKWVLEHSATEFDADGKATLSRGTVQDITALTQVERDAREYAQQTQAIVDNAVDGIITITETGVIQSFNRAAEQIFGYTAAEVLGRNVKMLMPEPYQSEHDGYLARYQATGEKRVFGRRREVEGLRSDGKVFPMELAVSHIERGDRPLYIGLVRDITERRRVERLKTEFVATVSHELRTPLTSITGALGLACGGALGPVSVQLQTMLDMAYKNSQRLTILINDLLDMEKMTEGKLHLAMQEHDLMALVEQAIEATNAYAQQSGLQIDLRERSEGVLVRVDAVRLQQVLGNLLTNAVKFSPAGSSVEVSVREIGRTVRVEVRDRGPGVPPDFRDRIFEKFAQADGSDARRRGGTGLGLAISKALIERMNGFIGYTSEPGQGACFYFQLPVVGGRSESGLLPAKRASGERNILVVEDDPDIARLIMTMLQRAGYDVEVANTAEQALQLLEQHNFAAMTLDLMLPDRNGVTLIREIRSRPQLETLPIVVLSAFVEEGQLAMRGELEVADWISKPVSETQLVAAMRRCLQGVTARIPRVLHIEDDPVLLKILALASKDSVSFDSAADLQQARHRLRSGTYDLVLLDLGLPDGSGLALVDEIRTSQPSARVIVLSGEEMTVDERKQVDGVLAKSETTPRELLALIQTVIIKAQIAAKRSKP